MKNINIEKTYKSCGSNNKKVTIVYDGDAADDYSMKDIDFFLNNCMGYSFKWDLKKYIRVIRTLFRDVDESSLTIDIQSDDVCESITFKDHTVISYYKNEKKAKGAQIDYKFYQGKIDFKYNGEPLRYFNRFNIEQPRNQIIAVLNEINDYASTNEFILNDLARHLVTQYTYFFGEEPNFIEPNINYRIQAMVYLLQYFGLGEIYDFILTKDNKKVPYNINLARLVADLYPYGKVNEKIAYTDESKEQIKAIGKIVRDGLANAKDKDAALMKFSTFIYAKDRCLYETTSRDEQAIFINCSLSEIEKFEGISLKLRSR